MGHFLLFPAPHGGGFVTFCALLKLIPTYIPGWGGSGFTVSGALEGFQSVLGSSICEMSVHSEAQFGENLSEGSSEGCCECSEASLCSASEDF